MTSDNTEYQDADAAYASGIAAFEAKNFSQAMRFLSPLAEQGDAEAQHRCAIMYQNGLGVVVNEEKAVEFMRSAAEQGHATSGLEYAAAIARLHAYARRVATWWEDGFDVLVTPTLATPPPKLGYLIDPEAARIRLLQTMPFTAQFNVSGQPAISLPLHQSSEGLPIGIQFVARYAGEAALLRLAAQLEQAAPWHDRHPEVFAAD